MIKNIRNKALKAYWTKGQTRGLNASWLPRLRRILVALDVAVSPEEMNVSGFYFHALSGDQKGRYSVRVTGNYRVTFGWDDKFATHVDLEDYH